MNWGEWLRGLLPGRMVAGGAPGKEGEGKKRRSVDLEGGDGKGGRKAVERVALPQGSGLRTGVIAAGGGIFMLSLIVLTFSGGSKKEVKQERVEAAVPPVSNRADVVYMGDEGRVAEVASVLGSAVDDGDRSGSGGLPGVPRDTPIPPPIGGEAGQPYAVVASGDPSVGGVGPGGSVAAASGSSAQDARLQAYRQALTAPVVAGGAAVMRSPGRDAGDASSYAPLTP